MNQVVLVDVFDTIIHRSVHPFSVIERWADFMACYCDIALSAPEIAHIRRIGYLRLVAMHEEPTYRQMMEDLYERLVIGRHLTSDTDLNAFFRTALDTETAIEMRSHFPNKRMISFLEERKKHGLSIHCVSDHYLPEGTIRQFLQNLGAAHLIDRIFVSCDHAANKRSGRLYDTVLSELKLSAEGVLMVGDNAHSDRAMARKAGIRTLTVRNTPYRLRNKIELVGRRCRLSRNPARKHLRDLSRTDRPFLAYALIYYAFTDRLYRKLKKAHARSVIFLAREGLFLKQCFDQYQSENISPSQRIRSEYLRLSRKASTGLMLGELSDETFEVFGSISVRSFIETLPFNDAEVDRAMTLFAHQDVDRVIEGFHGSQQLHEIRGNAEFQRLYHDAVLRNRTAFRKYIQGILGDERKIFLVDIGWRGKMQLNLHRFTSLPTAAFYLGFEFENCQPQGNTAEGLIFSSYPRLSPLHGILQSNRQFYEQLAAAPHGAACSYVLNEHGDVVVREQWPDQERLLYEGTVQGYQAQIAAAFHRLGRDIRLSPEVHLDNTMLARIVIRCGLSTKRAFLEFASLLDSSFAGNFRQETKNITYSPAGVRMDVKALLFRPETYFKYAVKFPRVLRAKGLQIGYVLVHLYRTYLVLNLRLRELLGMAC